MRKPVKIVLVTVATLLLLLVAGIAVIAARFDPNDYKPDLVRMVQEKYQRKLAIPGTIQLSFFPKLGADLGRVTLSERQGTTEFAAVDRVTLSLALLPLLSRQFVVDKIRVDGLQAKVIRFKDGSTSIDDLLPKEEEKSTAPAQPEGNTAVRLDIDGIHLCNARIAIDDRQKARTMELRNADLTTGKIAEGASGKLQFSADISAKNPDINGKLSIRAGYTPRWSQQHYTVTDMDTNFKGRLADFSDLSLTLSGNAELWLATGRFALDRLRLSATGKRASEAIDAQVDIPQLAITDAQVRAAKLTGNARLNAGTRTTTAHIELPSFEGTPQAFRIPAFVIDSTIKDDKLDARARLSGPVTGDVDKMLFASPGLTVNLSGKQEATAISGNISAPLSANFKTQIISISKLVADLSLPNPGGGALQLKANGNATLDLGKKSATATLAGNLDQSRFDLRLGMSEFSPAAYTFQVGIDQLDVDRYRRKPATAKPSGTASPAPTPTEPPIDLSALSKLRASGNLRIGALKIANIRGNNVRVDLRAGAGKLDINPINANLYGGSVAGSLSVVSASPNRFALRQSLSGVQVGPLLKDAIGKDPIEGSGNVQLDVTTSGNLVSQLKKQLAGTARLDLRDGAIRGVNIAQAVRSAKAKIGELRGNENPQGGTASTAEKTDFSELSGSFRIANGIAHNEDLVIKSPLVRVSGSGDINIGEDRLDYVARTTVVSTLQGQGGPELQALKGLTVPVRLSGPFSAIGWRVDFAGMASELAKQKLEEKIGGSKDDIKAKAQQSIDEEKAKVRDQFKDRLKGLLGK
ncbi:AsmA family protein [Herbaspirillum sp. GCM10030257]|uniref:AsmA family protein n=1 Tax=Herbaspirillum sp. GCM10030257 TaxID=3273393 RepID=UPI0036102765